MCKLFTFLKQEKLLHQYRFTGLDSDEILILGNVGYSYGGAWASFGELNVVWALP